MQLKARHLFIAHQAPIYAVASGRDEHRFFSASGDHHLAEWDIATLAQSSFAVKTSQPLYSLLYLAPFNYIVAGNSIGEFHVIDLNLKREIRLLSSHTKGIYDFAFDRLGQKLIVAGGDGMITQWSLPDFELLRSIPLSSEKIRQLKISPDNTHIAIASGDGQIRILEMELLNEVKTISAHQDGVTAIEWHPTKPVLVSGGKDAWLKCWNMLEDYKVVLEIPAHNFAIYSIAFHPTQKICATAGRDKTIKLWNSESFEPLQRMDATSGGHSHSVNNLLWMQNELISCGDDRRIIIWSEKTTLV